MEVEVKFSIPDELTFQRLLGTTHLAGFSLEERTVVELFDHYLDTADGAIVAGGYACRLRRENGRTLATLKGLGAVSGAIHRRAEHEIDLPEARFPQDWPPSTARDLALRLCGDQPLRPLFEIRQTRHRFRLQEGDRSVAELVLDQVRLGRGDAIAATYLELEAELLPDGSEQDLRRLAAELQDEWALTPETRSKFERGLALFGLEPAVGDEVYQAMDLDPNRQEQPVAQVPGQEVPVQGVELLSAPGIEPGDPMSEAGRKTFRFHFRRMLYHEPGTRLGEDVEALHDMRVATRRMRAAFRVFGDYYEPKTVAPYLKGLKRTGRALGPVRDLDVFRAKIQAYLSSQPASLQDSLDDLLAVLEVQREAARQRMIDYLDSDKYYRFAERFAQFVETKGMGSRPVDPPNGGEPRPHRVQHVAPMAIYERLAVVRAYDEWVNIPDPPLARLHALRIACKRLRYTLEFFTEVLGPDTKSLIKEVVAMQDHLGALQDAVVASAILRDYLTWGTWGHEATDEPPPETPVSAPGVEGYLAAKQAELQELVDAFPEAWQRITGTEFSAMVAQSVTVL